MWIGQSSTMELSGNHRCGCHAASMEGVCHGEACHRAEVLLHVRDGRVREADRGRGHRRKTRATLYGRGLTRWPPSSRRRTRPRASYSGTATFGIGKRPGGDLKSTWTRGIRFLGEIGRFGRRACEGGPRLLRTDRRREPRAGSGAVCGLLWR